MGISRKQELIAMHNYKLCLQPVLILKWIQCYELHMPGLHLLTMSPFGGQFVPFRCKHRYFVLVIWPRWPFDPDHDGQVETQILKLMTEGGH